MSDNEEIIERLTQKILKAKSMIPSEILRYIQQIRDEGYTPKIAYILKNDVIEKDVVFYGVRIKHLHQPIRLPNGDLLSCVFEVEEDV